MSVRRAQKIPSKPVAPIQEQPSGQITVSLEIDPLGARPESMFQLLMANIPLRVFWKGLDLRYLGGNDLLAKDAGLTSAQELVGKDDTQLAWRENAEVYRAIDREIIATGSPKIGYEENQPNPQGGRMWIRTSKVPLRDAQGRIVGVLGTYEDITEKKRREQALQESEERFRTIFERSTVGKSLTAPDGRLLRVNQAFANMLGRSLEEMLQVNFADITHPEDIAESRECIRCLMAGERQTYRMEKRYFHKNGSIVWADVSTTLLRDPNDQPLYLITSINDISERKRQELEIAERARELTALLQAGRELEENLKRVNERFALAAQAARLGVWDWDIVHNNMTWDAQMFALYGLRAEDFGGVYGNWLEAVHPDDRQAADDMIRKALQGEVAYDTEFRILWPDQSIHAIKTFAHVIRDETGRPLRMTGVNYDVTEARQAETALHEMSRKNEEALEVSRTAYWEYDVDRDCFLLNERFCRLHGITDLAGTEIDSDDFLRRYVHPEFHQLIRVGIQRAIETTDPNFTLYPEIKFLRSTGEAFWAATWCRVEKDASGRTVRMHGVNQNIHERRMAEEIMKIRVRLIEYADEHTLKELMTRTLDEIGAVTDSPLGFYHLVNENQIDLTLQAWSSQTTMDACLLDLSDQHYGVDQAGVWADALREKRPVIHNDYPSLPNRKGLPEGHAAVSRELVVPIIRAGRVVSILGIGNKPYDYTQQDVDIVNYLAGDAWDVMMRRKVTAELQEMNETLEQRVHERTRQLEALNQELEAFSYSVSHDLRAPLRAIAGWGAALKEDYDDSFDQTARHYLNRILAESARMDSLIDGLLRLSRLSKVAMARVKVDLSEQVRQTANRLVESNPERSVELVIQPGLIVEGDSTLLGVLLTNLLDNAWKYTARRQDTRIEFGQTRLNEEPVFFVRDNGVGFDMQYAQRLFGVFERLHRSSEFPGTGIGLAIAQRIVHRHGGRIWAEAEPDRGATFYFTLTNGSS